MADYRPWGSLNWVLRHIPTCKWSLLGCLSTGERSLAAWQVLRDAGSLDHVRLLRIANKPSRYDAAVRQRENDRIEEFKREGGDERVIEQHNLLEPPFTIVGVIDSFLQTAGTNVVLDVSTLPKRFFFPLLKMLLRSIVVRNLIVTYTSPLEYTRGNLAENFDQWDHIPLFSGSYANARPEMMVVNVGFEAFGLQEQVDQSGGGLPIKLLFPFPAPPQAFLRSWELVQRLQRHRSSDTFRLYRTDAKDVGDAFDRIVSLTDQGRHRALLAPFGPKPISVAMCIFATLTESQVFYSQPTVYHPQYSSGVDSVWAHVLRLDGQDYYRI